MTVIRKFSGCPGFRHPPAGLSVMAILIIVSLTAGSGVAETTYSVNRNGFGLHPFEIVRGLAGMTPGGANPSVQRHEAASGWLSADRGDGSNITWILQDIPLRSFLLPAVRPPFLTASFFGNVSYAPASGCPSASAGALGPAVRIKLAEHPEGALPLTNIAYLSSRSSGFDTFNGSFSRTLEGLGKLSLGARFSGHSDGIFGLRGYTALLQPSSSLDLFCTYSRAEGAWTSPMDYLEYAPFGGSEERFDAGVGWKPSGGSGNHGHSLYTRIVNAFRTVSAYDMSYYSFHESAAGYAGSFRQIAGFDAGLRLEGGLVNGGLYDESGYYEADSIGTWSCAATLTGNILPEGTNITCDVTLTAEYEGFAGIGGGVKIESKGPLGSFAIIEAGGRPRTFFEKMAGENLPGRERGVWFQAGLHRTPVAGVNLIPRVFIRAHDPYLFWQKNGALGTFTVEERRAKIYGIETNASAGWGEGKGEVSVRYCFTRSEISGFGRKPWCPLHELELRGRSPISLFGGRLNAEAGGFGRLLRWVTAYDGETMEWLPGYFTAGGTMAVSIKTLSVLFLVEYYPDTDRGGGGGFLGWRLGIDWNFTD